jgi:nitrogen fixation protein NifU and related proteins
VRWVHEFRIDHTCWDVIETVDAYTEIKCGIVMSQKPIEELSNTAQIHRMLASCGYSEKAIRYFVEKPYMGTIPDSDHFSEMTGTCGDTMSISIKVENGVIVDAKYQVLGCPGAIASAMAAVDLIKGKTIQEARKLNDGDVFRLLGEIPAKKHHCIQLAVRTLQKALNEYTQPSN